MTVVRLPALSAFESAPVAERRPAETRRREPAPEHPRPAAAGYGPAICGVTGFDTELAGPDDGVHAQGFDLALALDHGPYVLGSGLLPREHVELAGPTS